jgi:hypothetical protein
MFTITLMRILLFPLPLIALSTTISATEITITERDNNEIPVEITQAEADL